MKGFVLVCLLQLIKVNFCLDNQPSVIENQKHYAGYSVFRMVPIDEEDLENLRHLAEKDDLQLDFWKAPTVVNQAVDVMVSPEKVPFLEQYLIAKKIPRTILMFDVERYIMKERMEMAMPSFLTGRDSNAFFSSYKRLEEIHKFIDELADKNPNITSILSIGRSGENRDLKAIKIGSKSKLSKPAIWIDGGIHAREWISPATVTYIAHSLVSEYDNNPEVKELVDSFDWYILPVVNPDGYVYSHSVNRMWRKSRRGLMLFCRGVDLNRNFAFHWREGGSSSSPCSETYAGFTAFSEPETKAISDYIFPQKEKFVAYLAVHSYSQLWLTPWGWTSELPEDYDQQVTVAKEATQAISEVHGTKYRIGSSTNVLYVATGGADDWAYGVAGIKYSYTLELRDTGKYGFMLPSEQILPTGEETWTGVKAMAKAIKRDM
ncbi:carboxypeptidase A2 [Trichonephila inaurata madagascariensis]|uniref:Carboxypeptidase A2 n=1 Tax=Trichonephila inaurata madagascariensis TaxID=2747483 RepID=A0A8X6WX61_9ARAC|nr:carboxypeptidase A2 [Trichonephila inaurata madagascariensis]